MAEACGFPDVSPSRARRTSDALRDPLTSDYIGLPPDLGLHRFAARVEGPPMPPCSPPAPPPGGGKLSDEADGRARPRENAHTTFDVIQFPTPTHHQTLHTCMHTKLYLRTTAAPAR